MKKVKITQIRSLIGSTKKQKSTVEALGLRRIRHQVELNYTPQIEGMINKVSHLIKVEYL